MLAVLPQAHPLARFASLEIGRLADEPLLLLHRSFASRRWFDAACETANITPSVLLESGAPNAVLELAATGYGIAILPSMVRLERKGVRALPLVYRQAAIGKWTRLAWDPQRFLPPYVEAFKEALVQHAQKTFPGRELIGRAPRLRRPAAGETL